MVPSPPSMLLINKIIQVFIYSFYLQYLFAVHGLGEYFKAVGYAVHLQFL